MAMDEILEQFTTAIRLVWRRRWLAVFTAWGVSVAGWSLVATLPDTYESKSLVYVDTANILRPLLKGLAVENDLKAEVNLMQNTLLSRPNLMNVLQMTDLHLTADTDHFMMAEDNVRVISILKDWLARYFPVQATVSA